ncbi:MAG: Crp/Fnr family transcriptional regulator [Bacteroidota bacterium]|nr:Crp/Fnr family transcriptional regulator [Bacteroidota bacterium]
MRNKDVFIKQLVAKIDFGKGVSNKIIEDINKSVFCNYKSAGEIVLLEGKLCNDLFFLNKGLLRSYYSNSDGDDVTSSFVQEGEFFTNVYGFNSGSPSNESIAVIEDAIYCSINKDDYMKLTLKYSELAMLNYFIINNHRIELEERIRMLQNLGAKEKYRAFVLNYKKIIDKVKLMHIASFLGIRLETLSRIKKNNIM